jgi:hypothetical protein
MPRIFSLSGSRAKCITFTIKAPEISKFELAKILCMGVWAKTLFYVVLCRVHPQERSYSGGCGKTRVSEMPVAEVCNKMLKKEKGDCS